MRTPALCTHDPRYLLVLLALFGCLLSAPARAAGAGDSAAPIVHDPAAAAELQAAFEKLQALPFYRQSWTDLEPLAGEPRVTELYQGGVMRMTEVEDVGQWKGTAETVIVPGRAAYRFVSPDLDAYLAKLKARQRVSTLITVGSTLRTVFQGLAAGGPMGILAAAESGLSLMGAAKGPFGDVLDEDMYGKWHCIDLPDLPIPGHVGAAGAGADQPMPDESQLVERLPDSEIDGQPVRGYRSVTEAGGATLAYRNYVLADSGLPRRSEMEIDMPGFRSRSVMDFYDHGAAVELERPDCLGNAG